LTRPEATITPADDAWDAAFVQRFLRCTDCGGESFEREAAGARCTGCQRLFALRGPGLLSSLAETPEQPEAGESAEDAVTRVVRGFYESNPFPNYDGFESVGDLLSRASRSVYAAALDRQIPVGARVLEVGCGTGQLGAYLSVGGRAVIGADMTRASLELAGAFKQRHGLANWNLLHASLFDLPLRHASFDLVLAKGVLHHTGDARGAFSAVCQHVRPGGYVVLGLYNRIGRIPTTLRRLQLELRGGSARRVDVVMRQMAQGDEKLRAWYLDQYAHPHETRHSVDEVLRWLREEGLEFVSAVPSIRLGEPFDPAQPIFATRPPGGSLEHWLAQLGWIFSISREGALFDVVARRPEAGA